VRICARNSAGMSSPTEFVVGCQTTNTSTVTTPTTTSTGSNTTSTDRDQREDNNVLYIAIGSAAGVVVIMVAVALLCGILWKCKRPTHGTANSTSDCSNTVPCNPRLKEPPEYEVFTERYNTSSALILVHKVTESYIFAALQMLQGSTRLTLQ